MNKNINSRNQFIKSAPENGLLHHYIFCSSPFVAKYITIISEFDDLNFCPQTQRLGSKDLAGHSCCHPFLVVLIKKNLATSV